MRDDKTVRGPVMRALAALDEARSANATESTADEAYMFVAELNRQGYAVVESGALAETRLTVVPGSDLVDIAGGMQAKVRTAVRLGKILALLESDDNDDPMDIDVATRLVREALDEMFVWNPRAESLG